MLGATHSFLESPDAIRIACIGSWALTTVSIRDMIRKPLRSVFWPLVCGNMAGRMITSYTPPGLAPYVVGGIVGITAVGILARLLGFSPDPPRSKSIESVITAGLTDLATSSIGYTPVPEGTSLFSHLLRAFHTHFLKLRLSYNTHRYLLSEDVTVIETAKDLSSESVKEILNEESKRLALTVVSRIDKIAECVQVAEHLDDTSSIFIHDGKDGHVLIKGPNTDTDIVLSIKIDPQTSRL